MITSTQDWLTLLKQASPLLGVPLLAAGAAMMFFGWRLSRVCVAVTFAIIGYAGGFMVAQTTQQLQMYPWYGAIALPLIAIAPSRFGVSLAGGLGVTTLVFGAMKTLGLFGPALWIVAVVVMFCATALCAIRRRYVVIVLTSLEGSILLISGLTVVLVSSATVYNVVKGMTASSGIVAPFMLLVPTVMSFFYQISDVRRAGAEM